MQKKLFSSKWITTCYFIFASVLLDITTLHANDTAKYIYLGKKDAPITMYQFFSFHCVHCSMFHLSTLEKLKNDYIDKGLIKIVFIDVPIQDDLILWAHCLVYEFKNNNTAIKFTSLLLTHQKDWLTTRDPSKQLVKLAKLAGLKNEQILNAQKNEILKKSLVNSAKLFLDKSKITGTPAIIMVKGQQSIFAKEHELILGNISYDNLKVKIDNFIKQT